MAMFGFLGKSSSESNELPEIYPLALKMVDFRRADILATYLKILTDVVERTWGITEKVEPALWDNCIQSENNTGLVHMLAKAMTDKHDLFLVWKPALNILREADRDEEAQIKADYKAKGKSSVGVYVSFKNYRRTDILYIYSELEYCVLASLHKNLNISKAVQIKFDKLRESTSLKDADIPKKQALSIATALANGKDVYLDAQDEITTATPDTSPTEKAVSFLDAKRSFILGLPVAYISGLQTGGIGSTGEADTKAIERGLKQYFVSIIQPVLEAVFGIKTEFKSQDFRQITTALEVLKTFELTGEEIMSREAKIEIIQRVFELDPFEEKKALEKQAKEEKENVNDNTTGFGNQPDPKEA